MDVDACLTINWSMTRNFYLSFLNILTLILVFCQNDVMPCVLNVALYKILNYSLEKILQALTTAAEEKDVDRFCPIVVGLQGNSVHLQVSNTTK